MTMTRQALAHARATGDAEALLDVLELAGWGLFCAPLPERTALALELRDRALQADDIPKALTGCGALAFCHIDASDFAALDTDVQSALALSDELGHPRYRWRSLLLASLRASLCGHFAESDRSLTEIRQLSALIDDPALGVTLGLHELMQRSLQRRDDDVRALCEQLPETLGGVAPVYLLLLRAQCAARRRDVETARAAIAVVQPRAAQHMIDATELAEAVALAGTEAARRETRDALLQLNQTDVSGNRMAFHYEGPVGRLMGLLAASLGELDTAEARLREAHALVLQRGHLPWQAQIASELGHVLQRAGQPAASLDFFAESARLAQELGMPGLLRRPQATEVGVRGLATPLASAPVTMSREASGWRIAQGARVATLKDSRGLGLLAQLVELPGQELHVLVLAGADATGGADGDAGELLDQRARAAYRQRLAELESELAQAERNGQAQRASQLEGERQALLAELSRAFGLGGRPRRAGSATERARVNVQRRLRDAIVRITQADADLGRFFEQSVRTGTYCCFRP